MPSNPFNIQPSTSNVKVVSNNDGRMPRNRRKMFKVGVNRTQPGNRRFGVGGSKDKMNPNQQVKFQGTRPSLSGKATEEDEKLIERHKESKRPQEPEPPTASEKWWDSLLSDRDDDDDDEVSGFEGLRELFY